MNIFSRLTIGVAALTIPAIASAQQDAPVAVSCEQELCPVTPAASRPARAITNISDIYGNWIIKSRSPYWDTDVYTPVTISRGDTTGRVSVTFPQLGASVNQSMKAWAAVDLDAGTLTFPTCGAAPYTKIGERDTTEYYYYAMRFASGTSYNCLGGVNVTFAFTDDGTLECTSLPYTYNGLEYTGLGICARDTTTQAIVAVSLTTAGVSGMVAANGTVTFERYNDATYTIPVLGRYYTDGGVDYMEVGPVVYTCQGSPVRMVIDRQARTGQFTEDDYAYITYSAYSRRDDNLLLYRLTNYSNKCYVEGEYTSDYKTVTWKGTNSGSTQWKAREVLTSFTMGNCEPATLTFTTVDKSGLSLYVAGLGGTWDPAAPTEVTGTDGVYTFTLPAGTSEFKISQMKGTWTDFDAEAYSIKDGEKISDNTGATKYELVSGAGNIVPAYTEGSWTVTVDLKRMTVSGVNELSGIEGVRYDTDAPAEYYNLQGVRVAAPAHGVYILRQGSSAVKVIK